MKKQILYENLVRYIVENQDRFYRVAYGYAGNREDALDIVQNAVCKALEAYETIRKEDAVRTWFYRILVNESLAMIKKRKRTVQLSEDANQEGVYYEKAYEQGGSMEKELDSLEQSVQDIIRLRFFEELSLKEIALITGLNLNTVKTKLYRGLQQLKENMVVSDDL